MTLTDPFDLLKRKYNLQDEVKNLSTQLETLRRRSVEANTLGDLAPNMGQVNIANNSGTMTQTGLTLNSSLMGVQFWASLGVPSTDVNGTVSALALSGYDLFVGGNFTQIGGIAAANIATYNIQTGKWSNVGGASDLNNRVSSIVVSGSNVFMGGSFTNAGGVANADYIVRWDGSAWNAMGAASLNSSVTEMALSGTDLYVCGAFTSVDGVAGVDYLAKWDGSAWVNITSGLTLLSAEAITSSGSNVYVGGFIDDGGGPKELIIQWDGSTWTTLGDPAINDVIQCVLVNNNDVYVGGNFTDAGSAADADYLVRWDGSTWSAVGSGTALNQKVYSLAMYGNTLIAGGSFTNAADLTNADYLAAWNGTNWSALGNAITVKNATGGVFVLLINNTDIYFGGDIVTIDGGRPSRLIGAYLQTLQSTLAYLEASIQALQDDMIQGLFHFGMGANYANFDSNGHLRLYGDATVHNDVLPTGVSIGSGGSAPSFTAYNGNMRAYEFVGAALTKEILITFQMPHSYKEGSDAEPHLHLYIPNDATGGVVRFGCEYTWVNRDGSEPTTTTIYSTLTVAASAGAQGNKLLDFAAITGTGKTISSLLACRIFRDPTNAADTFGSSVWLKSADCHVEHDSLGSQTETVK